MLYPGEQIEAGPWTRYLTETMMKLPPWFGGHWGLVGIGSSISLFLSYAMARLGFRKGNRRKAPATVIFTTAMDPVSGHRKPCVYASCHRSGNTVGPVWGHQDQSVRRVLAHLTHECDCPASYHNLRECQGHRLVSPRKRSRR